MTFAAQPVHKRRAAPEEAGPEYRFAPIRHPLDRLISAWSYFCRNPDMPGRNQLTDLGYEVGMSLSDFVDIACEKHAENQHTMMQAEFIGPHKVDCLCSLGALPETWERLRTEQFPHLGLNSLRHMHKTDHVGWQEYYTREMRSKAELTFAPDMDLWERRNG